MSRNHNSVGYDIRNFLKTVNDGDTLKSYKRSLKDFRDWLKLNGYNRLNKITSAEVQAYERYLETDKRGYSPATIHTKLAPVCKLCNVPMSEIDKPKRKAGAIVRGRSRNVRSDSEMDNVKYSRLVTLQRVLGVRRAELGRLVGSDLSPDGKFVFIRQGKGGKDTKQYILPNDREIVRSIFENVGANERVFSRNEMENHINLHKLRAEHARDCYSFYTGMFSGNPAQRDRAKRILLKAWDEGHSRLLETEPEKFRNSRRRFSAIINDKTPYILRGDNAEKARKAGIPVEYDRLALMCVSVLHLAHWRLDVTVTNYLIP